MQKWCTIDKIKTSVSLTPSQSPLLDLLFKSFHECYSLNACVPPNLYVEILMPDMRILGDRPLGCDYDMTMQPS